MNTKAPIVTSLLYVFIDRKIYSLKIAKTIQLTYMIYNLKDGYFLQESTYTLLTLTSIPL